MSMSITLDNRELLEVIFSKFCVISQICEAIMAMSESLRQLVFFVCIVGLDFCFNSVYYLV